ncbi:hypothetical protein [Sorangium sp. So ce1389]|uniref:hypothetical protein n=1 Tax=Sorangium sp. So ce1389 TaxID=3133336 RepID=UPI003F5F5D39
MSAAAGATLVAGGFIAGAVITPDMTRYNRSAADVAKQTDSSRCSGSLSRPSPAS